jgi:hypothetical protein
VSFEVFTVVRIQVDVFWVVTPCSVAVGYQRFRGPSCLHLQGGEGMDLSVLGMFQKSNLTPKTDHPEISMVLPGSSTQTLEHFLKISWHLLQGPRKITEKTLKSAGAPGKTRTENLPLELT